MNYAKRILVTGGAGFIGSHLVKLLVRQYPTCLIVNYDLLTYAGNLENLKDIEKQPNYQFIKGDIRDEKAVAQVFEDYQITHVIHLAAESHVDRSITNPIDFIETNIVGTVVLLNIAKKYWANETDNRLFYHVSTDEVYGTLGPTGYFKETTAYDPRSPYSASKASSDHLVRAYYHTYGLPVVLSNCSNNYGPYQFPEKLIPLMINNIKHEKPLPVYGDGLYTRDWLWVEDHTRAIDMILHHGEIGQTYNIGGNNEWKNIDLVKELCRIMDRLLGRNQGSAQSLITFVKDRPGHDRRYAIDATKIKHALGWEPTIGALEGLELTAKWYLDNEEWLENVTSGQYQSYYKSQYLTR